MAQFRGKGPEILEDIATLVIGDVIPSPVALEDILVRFFRPRPNGGRTLSPCSLPLVTGTARSTPRTRVN